MNKELAQLRRDGWTVAVHNDYKLNGELNTFWLFTHSNNQWVRGEGLTDEIALRDVVTQLQMRAAHSECCPRCGCCNHCDSRHRPGDLICPLDVRICFRLPSQRCTCAHVIDKHAN